jgi:pyrimidine-nucleoside phosphorylase
MAIVWRGMNKREIGTLTDAMEHSGETIDLSSIKGIKVDKHSTGGVGDKTSLALGPLVAACGAKLAKMSGRGLGHTGGTLDKMESVPGTSIAIDEKRFVKQVNDIGIAIIGQTSEIDPADKKLYSLRDVTGTVESIPLIASSIMSKKLASGADTILLDVKFGSGAFMKTIERAKELATTMVEIGDSLHRDTRAIITDMDEPLGLAVGNALEVKEAIATLHGKGPRDFVELVTEAGAIMLEQAHIVKSHEEGVKRIQQAIADGSGFEKQKQLFAAQGGDISYLEHPEKFPLAAFRTPIVAESSGYVKRIDSMAIGVSAMKLGAGRATMSDVIDMSAGIVLAKKVGDYVNKGEVLATAHTNKTGIEDVLKDIHDAFELSKDEVKVHPIVHAYIKK